MALYTAELVMLDRGPEVDSGSVPVLGDETAVLDVDTGERVVVHGGGNIWRTNG